MNADGVNQWLTFIANISVVAGIVFLAVEIRQNTESQQASAYQDRAFAAASLWSSNASSPELIEAIVYFSEAGGMDNVGDALVALSPQDRQRIELNVLAQLAMLDNNIYQYRHGYLDEDYYLRIVAPMVEARLPLFEALGFTLTTNMLTEAERLNRQ